jgi:hypothetical protein
MAMTAVTRVTWAALVLVLAAGRLGAAPEDTKETKEAERPSPQEKLDDLVARYMAASQAGPDHRVFTPLAGSWSFRATMHLVDQPAVVVEGTSENRFVLGNRYLQAEARAGEGLKRSEMTVLYGFDNRRRQYFAVGMSSLASYALQPSGNYDSVNRSFILSGRERDETTGYTLVYRALIRVEDDDHHSVQLFYDVAGRAPYKVLEALFTRRPPAAPPGEAPAAAPAEPPAPAPAEPAPSR